MKQRDFLKDVNSSTILPLPLKIPAAWYDLLPKILPLVGDSDEQTKFYMTDRTIESFLQMWRQVLLVREGNFVWLHLGGAACFDIIPNFIVALEYRIKGRDAEIKRRGGMRALVEHWRTNVEGLKFVEDKAVLRFRDETLHLLFPKMWYEALNGAWHLALEKAEEKDEGLARICHWLETHAKQPQL